PLPLGACSHLCGDDVYRSHPMSCRFSDIMPVTCAPSKALTIPFDRANDAISFTGCTTPVTVVMWLTKMMRVCGVIPSLMRFSMSAGDFGGSGILYFFTTTP